MGISSAGVGSGLDVASLITQLVQAERTNLTAMETKKETFNSQISAYGQIKSSLEAFKTAVGNLKLSSDFSVSKATSSNTDLLTATADSTAAAGTYDIKVTQLAQAGVQASASQASAKTAMGASGTFTLTAGDKSFDITLESTDTLENIRDKINSAVLTGDDETQELATATIVNTGNGYKLVVASSERGTENAVSIDSNLSTALGGFTATQTAQNSKFTVNGLEIERATNSVDDVIDGVTLNLVKADTTTSLTLTVGKDTDAITTKVNAFISAYNSLASTISDLHKKGGTLEADNTATSVLYQLQSVFNVPANIAGSDVNYLAQVGISFKKDGTLALDSTAFTKALKNNGDAVTALFTDTEKGFAQRLYDSASDLLGTNGLVASRVSGLNSRISILDTNIDRETVRLDNYETRLRKQYSALDSLMGTLKNTSSYLSSAL
ncbi:MAG: flagellar cap protein [Betaproteobacteria bacterium]|nr:MAG: flagellar cap protein [Betaproteobacteria bacterium]